MTALIFIIFGHISYGITNVLWKNPQDKIGTLRLILFRSFFCFIIFLSFHFILERYGVLQKKQFYNFDILKTIAICAVNYFGLFFYLKSLKHTQISNTVGFSKTGLIFGVLIGIFVYNENLSLQKYLICLLIVIAVSLIEKSKEQKNERISKGLLFTVLSRLFWTTGLLFVPFIEKLGILLFCAILEATVFTMSLLLFLFQNENNILNLKNLDSKVYKELVALIILGTVGTFCLNFAIIKTNIIVFAFLGLIEPVVSLTLSVIYYQERLNLMQILGLALALFSSFLLSAM